MGSCNAVRQGMCFGVCFASVFWGYPSESGKMELQRVDCAQLWDEAFRIRVDEGMCVVKSSCVVCCSWKSRCGGKVGPVQQSLTSEDPVRQVPDLIPTETGVSLGQAGGDVCFFTAYRSSLNRKDGNFCHVFPKQKYEAPQTRNCNSRSHLVCPSASHFCVGYSVHFLCYF